MTCIRYKGRLLTALAREELIEALEDCFNHMCHLQRSWEDTLTADKAAPSRIPEKPSTQAATGSLTE